MQLRRHALLSGIPLVAAMCLGSTQAAETPPPSFETLFSELRNRVAENSPEIRQASEEAAQKRASVYTAWTRWFPHLDLQLSRNRSLDYSIVTSGSLGPFLSGFSPEEVNLSRWSLNLTFPIYRRAIQNNVSQAYAESALAGSQLLVRQTELDWRLRQFVGNYLIQRYKIATLQTSIELARTSLREAKARFEMGDRTKVDVIRAEANLISLESKSLTFSQDLAAARSALLDYAGLTRPELAEIGWESALPSEAALFEGIELLSATDQLLPALSPYLEGDGDTARERISSRIAVTSPLHRIAIATDEVSQVRARSLMAQEYPELLIQGSLGKQAPDWNRAFTGGQNSHSIALVLNIPLFYGGSTISTYYEKAHAQKSSEIRREQDIRKTRAQAEEEALQIRALLKALEAQRLSRERNEELVRLSQKSYHLGKTTLLELLTSQNDLIDSKLTLAQTKLNLAVLVRKLAWNLGVTSP